MIRRTTWIVLIVFLLVLAAALLWQRTADQRAAEATPTATAEFLVDMEGHPVERIELFGANTGSLKVEKGLDGTWAVVEPPGSLADPERIDQLFGDLGALRISAKLDSTPGLVNLGLNPANYRVVVEFEDGSTNIVYIGDKTPTQDGYYAYRQGDQVVVAEAFGIETLIAYLSSPPLQNTISPVLTPEATSSQEP